MNDRIRELALQAGGSHYPDVNPAQLIKFAELIVRECCDILDPGEHQLIARFQARKWLEKHFGIDN
jgi:hypothetical protein